jgi:putative ABC transport system ATP-binding protein
MAEPIVRVRNVHKVYNSGATRVHALRGVSLDIERGEMVAIMGPSGCGKTTLLNCLSGLDDVTEGEVYIDGVLLSSMDDDAKTHYRARRMGFVFQSYNLLPILTAQENVELPLLVAGVPPRVAARRARAMLAAVDLAEWAVHRPAELSAGQQQRVAIARALVNEPAIVWADEPTGNLDGESSAQVVEWLRRMNDERGQTLVLVTHDPDVAQGAHRILRMRSGEIVGTRPGRR